MRTKASIGFGAFNESSLGRVRGWKPEWSER